METTSITRLDELSRRVRVGPGDPSTGDVLYYAALLIETEGWNNMKTSGNTSSPEMGWTLHDSIGEACTRLSSTTAGGRGSKDATYYTTSGDHASLRMPAQNAVDAELQRMLDSGEWKPVDAAASSGRLDYTFNDEAKDADQVLAVLHRAREAA